jgi:hypothetical protein
MQTSPDASGNVFSLLRGKQSGLEYYGKVDLGRSYYPNPALNLAHSAQEVCLIRSQSQEMGPVNLHHQDQHLRRDFRFLRPHIVGQSEASSHRSIPTYGPWSIIAQLGCDNMHILEERTFDPRLLTILYLAYPGLLHVV